MPGTSQIGVALVSQDDANAVIAVTWLGKTVDTTKQHGGLNPYDVWVTLHGKDGSGTDVSVVYQGVRWNEQTVIHNGDTCNVTLAKGAAAASWSAWATQFPDVWTPISNTITF